MKGKIILEKSENTKRTKYYIEEGLDFNDYDYLICIYLPYNAEVDFLKLKHGFYKYIKRKLNSKQYNKDFPGCIKLIEDSINNNIDLIDNCNYIIIDCNDDKLFGAVNEFYEDKNIKIEDDSGNSYPISEEGYEEACRKYKNNSNVLIKIDGNEAYVTLEVFKQTLKKIDDIVNTIKSFSLSPLEEVIYAFDYTKNRYYVEEDADESSRKSRDLTEVLLGDKIVCEGYAAIFSIILQRLGFQASKYYVRTYKSDICYITDHVNAIVRIKDDKYHVDGIYYFDPTWDSKHECNELNDYCDMTNLNRYNHCGNYFVSDRYEDKTFGYISTFYDEELFHKIKNNQQLSIDEKRRINEYISMIAFENGEIKLNNNRSVCYGTNGISIEQFIADFDEEKIRMFVEKMLNQIKVIDSEVLLKAIYNVRKIEYYNNPEEFSLTLDDFHQILSNFRIYDRWYDDYRDDAYKFIDSKEQEIERVRLTKVLSNISKKR